MSTRPSLSRRTAAIGLGLAMTAGLVLSTPAVASAHPGVYDSETCAQSLTRVWSWPGERGDGSLIFSDAYELHLLHERPCDAPPVPVPPRADSEVGHRFPSGSERTC
jgi:hypothetical protein